jgi:hypothetical protein
MKLSAEDFEVVVAGLDRIEIKVTSDIKQGEALKKEILEWKRFWDNYYPLYSMIVKTNPSDYMEKLKEKAKKWKIIRTFFETSDLNKIYHYKEIVEKVKESISDPAEADYYKVKKIKEILGDKK